MERWQWQVVEAVYAAAQGEKAEAVGRLHRMELLFRKTGHMAGEITATGCRGLVQASMARNRIEMLAARQLLMRSVYLAQEQKQQAEEVAAAVADKCALMLSCVVGGKEFEEAMGWFRLQRAPAVAVHSFRLSQVDKILLGLGTPNGRGRRLSGLLIHEAHLQVREAAREVMMMNTSIMDDSNHLPVCAVLLAYERVAEAAMKRQQLSRALDMLREALALGSSSSSVGPFLSVGVYQGWHLWAWRREEAIWYRMGRLLVKLRPGDKIHLAAALAMFANSLQCALRDYGRDADEECRLRRANAVWWARLTIEVLEGCSPPDFAEAAACSVLEELVGPGRLGWSPISRSQELMEFLVEVVEVLVFFPPWQAVVMRHMEAVRAFLEHSWSGGSGEDPFMEAVRALLELMRRRSGGSREDPLLLFRWTHTLATACRRAGDRRTAARHFMRCRDMGLEQLSVAYALASTGKVEAAVRRVQQVLSLLTAPPTDESSPWPGPKMHAGLQPGDRILMLSEDEMLDTGIKRGLSVLIEECIRSGEKAAEALGLDAAVNWYHMAADLARVFPSKQQLALRMSHLSYKIAELQYKAGAWMESLQMLSDSLRQALSTARDIGQWQLLAIEVGGAATPGYVTKACRLVHRVQALLEGRAQVGDGWDLQQDADFIDEITHVLVTLGGALCALSNPEGIWWLKAVRDALLREMEMDGASGRAMALAGEEFTTHGLNLYALQIGLARAYSKLAHDSSKAAQMYEECKDMATCVHNRLSMQLYAAWEWAHAGDLLSAEEEVLEALDFLVPPEQAASASEVMSMLWGSAAAESSRFDLLVRAAWLVGTLWPREQRREHAHMHAKLKAALEAVWEHCCRSLANYVDYLKNERIVRVLMLLVDVYQDDKEWAAAEGLLDALAPQLKDSTDFQRREVRQLRHRRRYLQAARFLKDLASEDIDDATGSAAIHHADLLLSSADDYKKAGQHQLAAKMLNRLERMIRATTSWPPPGPGTDHVGPKQHFEFKLCMARASIARETGRYDEEEIWLHKAASVQEAIINDIQQRQLSVAKHLSALVFVLTREAFLHTYGHGGFNHGGFDKVDVKGLEDRIERIQTLDPDAFIVCQLRIWLLLARGDMEEAAELMRELFLLMAERQEGRGGDDDSWITDYNYGDGVQCMSLAMLVDSLELIHVRLGRHDKALLWAERGRMRLFMHRVHAQQRQEDDPEWAMDSTPNDFDRDDGKALDMVAKVLPACGPNVALLEYSYSRQTQKLRVYSLFRRSDLKLVAGFESPSSSRMGIRSITLDCPGIEQLVKKARDSIIARPQQKGEAAAATIKNRHARQQQLRYLAQLHSLLVAPVLKELPDSCDTLIFVPDDCLSLVPFAALYDESAGQFLIQQKQVVVAPCLRALHRCLDLQDRFFSTASTQLQQPFVAGNPFPMGLGLPQLPHAQEEAAAVADILGVKPCLGAAVTKEAVLKGLGHSSVSCWPAMRVLAPSSLPEQWCSKAPV